MSTRIAFSATILLLLAACNSGTQLLSIGTIDLGTKAPEVVITPRAPGPDGFYENCLLSPGIDACLTYKNLYAQEQSLTDGNLAWPAYLAARQRYAVTLRGLNTSGLLENDSIKVMSAGDIGNNRTRVTATSNAFRVSANAEMYSSDKGSALSQVSSYYWMQRVIEQIEASPTVDRHFGANKQMPVFPYARVDTEGDTFNNAYFDSSGPLIAFGFFNFTSSTAESLAALSGDIVAHEFGHSQLYFANPSNDGLSTSTHQVCYTTPGGNPIGKCCKTSSGCMAAIHEGLADWRAALLFPENPSVGEGLVRDLSGTRTCETSSPRRDPRRNFSLTASTAFPACVYHLSSSSTVTFNGDAYTMATLYTAALWEIRTNFNSALPSIVIDGETVTGAAFFEDIVYEHMPSLSVTSTFQHSRLALKNAADALKTRFSLTYPMGFDPNLIIDAEFSRRGLP